MGRGEKTTTKIIHKLVRISTGLSFSSRTCNRLPRKCEVYASLAAFFTTPPSSLRVRTGLRRRVFEQHRFSAARGNDSFGGWVYFGESRRIAVGTHGGWNVGLFPGRHLCLLDGTAIGP